MTGSALAVGESLLPPDGSRQHRGHQEGCDDGHHDLATIRTSSPA